MKVILITGGARSGKSQLALEMAGKSGQEVLFVATATAGDEEMRRRIEEHRSQRPSSWRTLEAETNIGAKMRKDMGNSRTVIIDCISLLINNIFSKYTDSSGELTDIALLERDAAGEMTDLLISFEGTEADFIIVTNEVGFGLVPLTRLGRVYRDFLGKANQILAERADEVYLMVSGLPVKIKP